MAIPDTTLVSILNDLIETCKDGEKGYREASEEIHDAYYRVLFGEFARLRSAQAIELQNLVRIMHSEPDRKGSVAGVVHRGWMNLKNRVSGHGDETVIRECERGEEAAIKNYLHALGCSMPDPIRNKVEMQLAEIKETLTHLHAMKEMAGV